MIEAPIRSTLALILVSPALVAGALWLLLVAMYLWIEDTLKGTK
jgi:hypothetical protein